ncbi:E3 ubiquitin-protein ligase TRIM71-like [Saccostrea cucullata]|uniref:E3 ubiquitin-protein ligase TRIM71-like n=1 Tax=Saccostrea cuccullata TaxID=36930 RepID=UPI002ED36B00
MSYSTVKEQHYIECATCNNYSSFYCNTCHKRMCEKCREGHIRYNENRNHQVVQYKDRLKQLPTEKCLFHPTKILEIFCVDCPTPICSKCFTTNHNGHQVLDLEVVYNECLQQCQEELINIRDTIIPQCEEEVKSQVKSKENVRGKIAELRLSMNQRADEIKAAVDTVLAENNAKLDLMEASILDEIEKQQKNVEDYISYLKNLIEDCYCDLSSCKLTEVIRYNKKNENVILVKFPEITEPGLPTFAKDRTLKKEIEQIFGEIKPCEDEKVLGDVNKIKESVRLFNSKPTQKLRMERCSSLIKTQEVKIPRLSVPFHISPDVSSNTFWANGDAENLIQFDLQGNIFQNVSTGGQRNGYHSITREDNLLYTDYDRKTIYRINRDMTTSTVVTTKDWEPQSIFSSQINGDILVGMNKKEKWKITRYNREGEKIMDIQKNENGKALYSSVSYLTENINGDICTSDNDGGKVQVVTRSGEHRFTYSGQYSVMFFIPYGICTDVLGNILVCCSCSVFNFGFGVLNSPFLHEHGIHLLNQDGQLLSVLLKSDLVSNKLCALCVDDQSNLIVGSANSPTIRVYKYLKGKRTL